MNRQDWMGVCGFIAIGAFSCWRWLAAPPAFVWITAGALVVFVLLAASEYDWLGKDA